MRLNEIFLESKIKEGAISDIIAGYTGNSKKDIGSTKKSVSSPFDIIPARDAKFILQNIINGKPLDANQIALIKKVYSRL